MNILVTGASGFVGRNFILRAPADWRIVALYNRDTSFPEFLANSNKANVTPVRCDLSDLEQISTLTQQHGQEWDACLFLAARVDIPWSTRQPREDLMTNACSPINLMEAIRVDRFIYFSSGAVYDGLSGEVLPDARLSPTLPYAISKLAAEHYVGFYSQRRRTIAKHLNVRFFGAYGPYEAEHKIYNRLIRAFAVEGKRDYTIYGSGKNLIDAMYIDDAVDAIQQLLTGDRWNTTVNLAGGNPVTIETLVREVAEALDVKDVRIEKQGVAHESNDFWGSSKWFTPRIGLPEGIRRFRDFLLANQ